MKLIALEVENPEAKPEQFAPLLKDEAKAVWELHQKGFIREAYFRTDRHTAVLVLECENVLQAQEVLSTLPLVQHDLIRFDIMPLAPYSGFSRLFV